jgi:hypothetical protein
MCKYLKKIFNKFRDDKIYFILSGEITLIKRNYGKILKITSENTLGEEFLLDRKFSQRKESAFVESPKALLIEITLTDFLKVKEIMYEMGLKKDYLMLESLMRRNFTIKKNLRV